MTTCHFWSEAWKVVDLPPLPYDPLRTPWTTDAWAPLWQCRRKQYAWVSQRTNALSWPFCTRSGNGYRNSKAKTNHRNLCRGRMVEEKEALFVKRIQDVIVQIQDRADTCIVMHTPRFNEKWTLLTNCSVNYWHCLRAQPLNRSQWSLMRG